MIGYCRLTVERIIFRVPSNMSKIILDRVYKNMENFAKKLSTETLLNFSESLEISNNLYASGQLVRAKRYYEDHDFESFMNYYHGLKVGGLI